MKYAKKYDETGKKNIEILTSVVNEYQGTLIVLSHNEMFQKQIGVNRTIALF